MKFNAIMAIWLFINLYTFILYGYDKYCAVQKKWRVPEAVLLLCSFLGGALGALSGMCIFRHKTKHRQFLWFIPLCLFVQILIVIIYIIK